MKQAQHAAITSNEKIFPVLAKKLASKDKTDYVGTADKLKIWLGSEKAYYAVARPKIVEMLEIAYATFAHEFVRTEPSIADDLRQLVQSVIPFIPLFTESQLQARLQRVVHQTENLMTALPVPSASSAQESPVQQQPMPMSFTVPLSQIATASAHGIPPLPAVTPITQPTAMGPVALPLPSTSDEVKTEPSHLPESELRSNTVVPSIPASDPPLATAPAEPSHAPPPLPPEEPSNAPPPLLPPEPPNVPPPFPPEEPSNAPPPLPPAEPSNAPPPLPPPAPVLPKPQPKRMRKPELSEELKARDLDWFRFKRQCVPASEEPGPSPPSPSRVEQSPPLIVRDGMSIPTLSPSRRRKTTARMVPSRYPRKVLPFEATQESADSASTFLLMGPVVSTEPAGQQGSPGPTHVLEVQQPVDPSLTSAADKIVIATAGQQLGDVLLLDVRPAAPVSPDDDVAGQTIQLGSPKAVADPVVTGEANGGQVHSSATDDVPPEVPGRVDSPALTPVAVQNIGIVEQSTEQQESRDTHDQPVSSEVQQPACPAPIPGPANDVVMIEQPAVHRGFPEIAHGDEQTATAKAETNFLLFSAIPRSERMLSPPVAPADVTGETERSPVTDLYGEPPQFGALLTKSEPSPMEADPPKMPGMVSLIDASVVPPALEAAEGVPLLQQPPHAVEEFDFSPPSPPASHQGRDTANSLPTEIDMAPLPQIKPEPAARQIVFSPQAEANRRRFGGMMVVIHGLQGKPYTCTHNIEFNLDDALFASISAWVNRRTSPDQVSQNVCISLACYRLPDLFATIQSKGRLQGIAELTSRSSCSWPTSSCLSLQVERHGKHQVVSLSPPIILTPEKCVDISSFMSSGHNTIQLTQQGDLSEFAFVFHAHHPSEAQLAELRAIMTANQRWKDLIGWLGSPILSQSPWPAFDNSIPSR